jgi:hypothetical protein
VFTRGVFLPAILGATHDFKSASVCVYGTREIEKAETHLRIRSQHIVDVNRGKFAREVHQGNVKINS